MKYAHDCKEVYLRSLGEFINGVNFNPHSAPSTVTHQEKSAKVVHKN
jgi:hypothetical protein